MKASKVFLYFFVYPSMTIYLHKQIVMYNSTEPKNLVFLNSIHTNLILIRNYILYCTNDCV